jgi:hypothetical protein
VLPAIALWWSSRCIEALSLHGYNCLDHLCILNSLFFVWDFGIRILDFAPRTGLLEYEHVHEMASDRCDIIRDSPRREGD